MDFFEKALSGTISMMPLQCEKKKEGNILLAALAWNRHRFQKLASIYSDCAVSMRGFVVLSPLQNSCCSGGVSETGGRLDPSMLIKHEACVYLAAVSLAAEGP